MERLESEARGKAGLEDSMSNSQGFVLAYSGHLKEARKMSRRAADLAQRADLRETVALYEMEAALREALFGNVPAARQRAMAALGLSKSRDVEYGVALTLALSGDSSRSPALTDDLSRRFPQDTIVVFTYRPTLRALLALNHSEPSNAIELLQTAIPYELGAGNLYPAYVRGEAYLAARQGREAAVEFQKILDHRGIVVSDPIGALAHLQLGRAYAIPPARQTLQVASGSVGGRAGDKLLASFEPRSNRPTLGRSAACSPPSRTMKPSFGFLGCRVMTRISFSPASNPVSYCDK